MGYFLGKGTFIKSNYGFSSNVSVFCRCYGYSIVTVLDALDHDPYCGLCHEWISANAAMVPFRWFLAIAHGYLPLYWIFPCYGYLPVLTDSCCVATGSPSSVWMVTLLRAFTAAMIVPCCEFSSVFSDLPIQGLCRGNGVSYITGFRCCE